MSLLSLIIERVRNLLIICDLNYRPEDFLKKMFLFGIGFGLGAGLIFFNYSFDYFFYVSISVFLLFESAVFGILIITSNNRISLIEELLPDFLGIMASNIRSGLTYDRALLMSARKEFGPLSKEIDRAAKQTLSGTSLTDALMEMTERVHSDMFSKTIRLIVEGVTYGGNLADLLENTSLDIRRFSAMRKEVSATVLVYQLFMVAAASIGAPVIYAVANFLIKVITATSKLAASSRDVSGQIFLPFFKGEATISSDVVFWFALFALFITSFFGSLAIGVISKGKESEGIAVFPILFGTALAVFFGVRFMLEAFSKGIFLGI